MSAYRPDFVERDVPQREIDPEIEREAFVVGIERELRRLTSAIWICLTASALVRIVLEFA